MPKKNNELVPLLTLLPWWASLLLAPLAYVFLSQLVPAILGDNVFAPVFAFAYTYLGFVAAGIFILGAPVSSLAARRKRR